MKRFSTSSGIFALLSAVLDSLQAGVQFVLSPTLTIDGMEDAGRSVQAVHDLVEDLPCCSADEVDPLTQAVELVVPVAWKSQKETPKWAFESGPVPTVSAEALCELRHAISVGSLLIL
jgi:hypothetical protein